MDMNLAPLKDKNCAELTRHLQELAPAVLGAKAAYDELVAQQRTYTAARELKSQGLWIGSRIRLTGKFYGVANPVCEVVGMYYGAIEVNVLKKDGTFRAENVCLGPSDTFEIE